MAFVQISLANMPGPHGYTSRYRQNDVSALTSQSCTPLAVGWAISHPLLVRPYGASGNQRRAAWFVFHQPGWTIGAASTTLMTFQMSMTVTQTPK